jgi:putative spermidine/putrescine transport system ATP-binding protein
LRSERTAAGVASSGPYLSGRVAAVEYQGPSVRIAIETEFTGQATALLPDKPFYAGPVAPGEPATLVWSAADAHALPNS